MNRTLKRKTSMVLHQIEEALGNFVLTQGITEALNENLIAEINKRENNSGRSIKTKSVKDIVEASYLNELFSLAIDLCKDNSLIDSINYLYSLFINLDIYEIRNTISHPNRQFWDCYWYRVASIASDPVIDILNFKDVKKTLISAENNLIIDPPEEWINKIIWEIPNNLPTNFDHALTGLIGRKKELTKLKQLIGSERIKTVALVAPGGIGKTAIALDLLNEIVKTPSFSKNIDAAVFVSLKTEKLTNSGIVSLDSLETIEELKKYITTSINEIFDEDNKTFDDLIIKHKKTKILLCLDNLETLLRDSPDSFEDLNIILPSEWKVLVTSRIAISHTILQIDSLNNKSAIALAQNYLIKKGGKNFDEVTYKRLVENCHHNPLAIRLTIDYVLTGKPIPESLNVANKEIAEFSYNNLIEVLSSNAIKVLETIFVEDISTRISLCEILTLSQDDIASAVGELSKTSLISRTSSEQGEEYNLNNSVRELLLVSPKNIEVRSMVQEFINSRREMSKRIDLQQSKNSHPVWHKDYIDTEINENLKILITEVNSNIVKSFKNSKTAVYLYRKLMDAQFLYKDSNYFHRSLARILEALKDYSKSEEEFKIAISLDSNDIYSKYLLARLYHKSRKYNESSLIYKELIKDGWANEDSDLIEFGQSLYNGYFLALLYSARHDEMLEESKHWKESKYYRGIIGVYRATAWKRKMEEIVESNPEETVECLLKSSRIFTDIFRNHGYFVAANTQSLKLFDEIEFCFSRKVYTSLFPEAGIELLNFISNNIIEISKKRTLQNEKLIRSLSKIEIDNNPFKLRQWSSSNNSQIIDVDKDLLSVKVTKRPNSSTYMFCSDCNNKNYFLHYDKLKNGTFKDWYNISEGTFLHIKPGIENLDKSAITAEEVYIVN